MTSYLTRLKAFNAKNTLREEVTKPTDALSSVLSDRGDTTFRTSQSLSSVPSVHRVGVSGKGEEAFAGFVGLSGETVLNCKSDTGVVGENQKSRPERTARTDESCSIVWKARAEALIVTGLPRSWAEPFAKLLFGPPPGDFDPAYWARVLPGANVFADEWAARAHSLGWKAKQVFGLDDIKPAARHDMKGVAWLLTDAAHVVALDEHGADIMTKQASRLRFYRRFPGQFS
jgi:hypothetical protein